MGRGRCLCVRARVCVRVRARAWVRARVRMFALALACVRPAGGGEASSFFVPRARARAPLRPVGGCALLTAPRSQARVRVSALDPDTLVTVRPRRPSPIRVLSSRRFRGALPVDHDGVITVRFGPRSRRPGRGLAPAAKADPSARTGGPERAPGRARLRAQRRARDWPSIPWETWTRAREHTCVRARKYVCGRACVCARGRGGGARGCRCASVCACAFVFACRVRSSGRRGSRAVISLSRARVCGPVTASVVVRAHSQARAHVSALDPYTLVTARPRFPSAVRAQSDPSSFKQ